MIRYEPAPLPPYASKAIPFVVPCVEHNRVSGNALLMKPPHKVAAQHKTDRMLLSAIRLPPKLTAAIDKWTEQNGLTSRSEAIHRLVELGLAASQPLQLRRNLEAASKALELAAQEIDKGCRSVAGCRYFSLNSRVIRSSAGLHSSCWLRTNVWASLGVAGCT